MLLFVRAGLSGVQISSLFAIWSISSAVLELPTGLWADRVSRRRLLALAPVLTAACFALWTVVPCYPAFAVGFVLWGAGDALRSGCVQALVYTELTRIGSPGAYRRLIGRSEAVSGAAVMTATALAGPVLAVGGYRAVGAASVAVALLGVPIGWSFPASAPPPEPASAAAGRGTGPAGQASPRPSYPAVLRVGLGQVRHTPRAGRAVLLVAVITGVGALEEYVPLLARSTGLGPTAVPLSVLVVTAGLTVGGWLAGRGDRWAAPVLAAGAGCLAVGAASGRPAGLALVAVAFGIFQWAIAGADTRLQELITDEARATVTSVAGLGREGVATLTFAGYATAAPWVAPGSIFAGAAVAYLLAALAMRPPGGRHRSRRTHHTQDGRGSYGGTRKRRVRTRRRRSRGSGR